MAWRPWTRAAARIKKLRGHKRLPPEPIPNWKILKGDLVQILTGTDKGKQGNVVAVARAMNKVFVGGLNAHTRVLPTQDNSRSMRISSEAPLHVSNVALVDPVDGMPCRVKYQFTEEGEKVRVSRRSGRVIPKAPQVYQRKDFKSRSGYQEGKNDTVAAEVQHKTYLPTLLMFHEDINKTVSDNDQLHL